VECLLGLGTGLGRKFAYAANATPELGDLHPPCLGNGNGVTDDSGSDTHAHGKWNWRDKTPGHHSYLPSSRGHHDDDDEQDEDEDEQDDFEEFDPDELPTLLESAKIVFPSLRGARSADSPEEEENGGGMWR
jgi:hypothetical protein